MRNRRRLALAGTLLAAALLGGCGSGDEPSAAAPSAADPSGLAPSAPPPSAAAPSLAPPTALPTAPSTAPPTTAAVPTAPSATPACAAGRLGTTLRPDPAGGADKVIALVNQGSTPCTLTGHPAVAYVAGSPPKQVGAAAAKDGVPAAVVLAPGATATARLRITDPTTVDRETCQSSPVDALRVTPPGGSGGVVVAAPGSTCADPAVVLLSVGPLQAG